MVLFVSVLLLGALFSAGAMLALFVQPVSRRPVIPPVLDDGPVRVDPRRLERHVRTLSLELTPRDHAHPEVLDRVAEYIATGFEEAGARAEPQPYAGGTYRNVLARLGPELDGQPRIILGAHYDSHGGLPAADDNASGVAVLLELARLLARTPLRTPVELVGYTLEEHPYAMTPLMGSAVHAESVRQAGGRVRAMFSLEMLGYFSDEPGSQSFPLAPMRYLFPSTGNFVAVVGRLRDFPLVRRIKAAMRQASDLPVESLNAPRWVPGIDQSDHISYWDRGYPAVMVTDTAFLRNPNYHTGYDTPDTLDYDRMAEATKQIYAAVLALQ